MRYFAKICVFSAHRKSSSVKLIVRPVKHYCCAIYALRDSVGSKDCSRQEMCLLLKMMLGNSKGDAAVAGEYPDKMGVGILLTKNKFRCEN